MATLNGGLASDTTDNHASITKGRFVTLFGIDAGLGPGLGSRYKMQAPASGEPNGYITWVNETGDDTGKPAGSTGPSIRIARW